MNTQTMPLISFIIPYYNVPLPLVMECVESITRLRLGAGEREIIVVDDGSDADISRELSTVCGDIVYIRQVNGGLSDARNTGIDAAKGEYIQFVDADDRIVTAVYDGCVEKLRAARPDLLMFGHTSSDGNQKPCRWAVETSGAAYMAENNLHPMAWGYVFRRSILGSLRFFKGTFHEDEEFTPQLMIKARRMEKTDAAAYFYRLRTDSITTTRSEAHTEKRLDDVWRIIRKLNSIAASLQGVERRGMQRRVDQLTMDYIFNIIRMKKSRRQLDGRIGMLRSEGLFPLPARDYTISYGIFRLLADSDLGLRILSLFIPLIRNGR